MRIEKKSCHLLAQVINFLQACATMLSEGTQTTSLWKVSRYQGIQPCPLFSQQPQLFGKVYFIIIRFQSMPTLIKTSVWGSKKLTQTQFLDLAFLIEIKFLLKRVNVNLRLELCFLLCLPLLFNTINYSEIRTMLLYSRNKCTKFQTERNNDQVIFERTNLSNTCTNKTDYVRTSRRCFML